MGLAKDVRLDVIAGWRGLVVVDEANLVPCGKTVPFCIQITIRAEMGV